MQELGDYLRVLYPDLNSLEDFVVEDKSDGKGPFIAEWNTDKYLKPTVKELEARSEEYHVFKDKEIIDKARKAEYPPIVDQLDMIWHAMNLDKIPKDNEFYTKIKEVKDRNPYET